MTIRQQNANEELVHKLRSMLNDLPTLRTRALKKLKYWREAAIKRLLARQRELEKTLLEKFERLEYDTISFVDKIERKKLHQQRFLQNESFDYQNKCEIDRISTNLRMIREELEQSKLILAAGAADDEIDELIGEDLPTGKLPSTSRFGGTLSSKTSLNKSQETNDLGSELKRVLDICTSPQRSSSSLSADEKMMMKYGFILPKSKLLLTKKKKKKFDAHQTNSVSKVKLSPLQSLDHTEYSYDTKSKQTAAKVSSTTTHPKPGSQTVATPRKNTRIITNGGAVPTKTNGSSTTVNPVESTNGSNQHKLFAFESFDDSIRRFQRLREIRKNLRTKYDDQMIQPSVESKARIASPPPTNVVDAVESTSDNRNGSQQKLLNIINRSMPPTPPTTKSSAKSSSSNSTTPRKNGETRHTIFAREPVSIPIERVAGPPPPPPPPPAPPAPVPVNETNGQSTDPTVVELYDQAANSVNPKKKTSNSQERRHRSRTLEAHQVQAVDNQIYGCPSSSSSSSAKAKQNTQQRSESQKHRSHRISMRRSSEDHQDKYMQLRRSNEFYGSSTQTTLNETWFDIGREHWSNLLENGWRPTADTPGVTCVAIADTDRHSSRGHKKEISVSKPIDLYEQVSRNDYYSFFEQLEFAYARTINLGNEFWRFLEIDGDHHLCLYHQLNKQFIMYKPEVSLLTFPWPYDGIVDISWSKTSNTWVVATQTQIIICNRSFSKILQAIDINGDWPKRITSCQSSIFHTYKLPPSSITPSSTSTYNRSSNKDRPQFLLERYDYKLNSLGKHILESSTIWDIEADDLTEHLAVLCDVALLIFDYQLNLLKQIEVTGFKVSTDHFGGWLVADYNASCLWQIRRNEFVKANKILHVERPWSVILDRSSWNLVTLSETQNRAKRLLFFTMKNLPNSLGTTTSVNSPRTQSQLSTSTSSSISNSSV